MKIYTTELAGVVVAKTTPFIDHRGAFSRLYCEKELSSVIGNRRIVQINHSRTSIVGAVRGMHFQRSPHMEMKLVRCVKGRVWDVAVDLRTNSPTFLHWYAEELSQDNAHMLVIPEGCAHGFQVLEPNSELLYLHTDFYTSECEDGVSSSDPALNIAWPLPITDLSLRDSSHLPITPDFTGIAA